MICYSVELFIILVLRLSRMKEVENLLLLLVVFSVCIIKLLNLLVCIYVCVLLLFYPIYFPSRVSAYTQMCAKQTQVYCDSSKIEKKM